VKGLTAAELSFFAVLAFLASLLFGFTQAEALGIAAASTIGFALLQRLSPMARHGGSTPERCLEGKT